MIERIVLAGGCFWCTEAIFERLKGVSKVTSGYANSRFPNPTYDMVCTGITNAAESIEIEYDTNQIKLENILEVFFTLHDPTSINQQGNDIGTEYRSAIFYLNNNQKTIITNYIFKIKKDYDKKIVTEVSELKNFTPAESYHQQFYNKNPQAMYCNIIISPKIKKLYEKFGDITKDKN